jgi:hypothetical protein
LIRSLCDLTLGSRSFREMSAITEPTVEAERATRAEATGRGKHAHRAERR